MKLLESPKNVLELIPTSDLLVATIEELLSIHNNIRQSQLVSLITKRKISSKSVPTIIRNETEELNPSELFQKKTNSDQETVLKAFDKSVISMNIVMFKLATVMESFRQKWIFCETLLQHKNMMHAQIDLLIRQKKRHPRIVTVSGYKIFRRRKIP